MSPRREIRVAATARTTRVSRIVRVRRNEGAVRIELGLGELGGRIVATALTPTEARKISVLLAEEADGAEVVLRKRAAEDGGAR